MNVHSVQRQIDEANKYLAVLEKKKDKVRLEKYQIYYDNKPIFPLPFRNYQKTIIDKILHEGSKNNFVILPRRSGKDYVFLFIEVYLTLRDKGEHSYFFPTYGDARDIIWLGGIYDSKTDKSYKYLDILEPLIEARDKINLVLSLVGGGTLFFKNTDVNADGKRGRGYRSATFSELAFYSSLDAYDNIIPMLTNTRGVLNINTTPNGFNHAWSKFNIIRTDKKWFSMLATCEELKDSEGNRYIGQDQIEDAISKGLSPGKIRQEFYCEPYMDSEALYYGEELQFLRDNGKIRNIELNSNLPVYFNLDLGINKQSGRTFIGGYQVTVDNTPKVLFEYEGFNKRYKDYCEVILDFKNTYKFRIGAVILPHDATKRSGDTLKSAVDVFSEYFDNVSVLPRVSNKESLIDLSKGYLRTAEISIKCEKLLACLSNYQRIYNSKLKYYMPEPAKTPASHGADMWQYVAHAIDSKMIHIKKRIKIHAGHKI